MDYSELSNAFVVNPYYNKNPFDSILADTTEEPVVEQVAQNIKPSICSEYQSHIITCPHCMYTQERKRSNLVNLLIIFALLWLIFRK